MMENQLSILSESLDQKIQLLQEIQEYNKRQEQAFSADTVDISGFDEAVEEKGRLIERLIKLDEGFELLYARIAEQLKDNRQKYASEIGQLQQKITQVTELGNAVQVQEMRNKQLVEQFFAKERAGINQNRRASKVAYDYYKKMNNSSVVQSQFYDSKK